MCVETPTAAGALAQKAVAHIESVVQSVLRACPRTRQFTELLYARCGVRCEDIIDHLILPSGAFETGGWLQLGENRWRHPDPTIPDVVREDRAGFAIRVDDIQQFLKATQRVFGDNSLRSFDGRMCLIGSPDVVVEATDNSSWRGLCEPPTRRIIRRAQIHKQLLRTRPRQFKNIEGGLALTLRLVKAAAADLGSAWASLLFLSAEREFWASRCEAGFLAYRRQSQLGIGWSNVEYHSYDCSRKHFHLYVQLFEALGFQAQGAIHDDNASQFPDDFMGRTALTMKQRTLRTVILLKVDTSPGDRGEPLGHVPLSPATWHGQSGLWCALHGESLLEGGMSHIAARYDAPAVRKLFEREHVELLPPLWEPDLGLQLSVGQQRAVDPRHVHLLRRRGFIGSDAAEDFRSNGAIATHFAIVDRNASGRLPCSPETPLTCGVVGRRPAVRRRSAQHANYAERN